MVIAPKNHFKQLPFVDRENHIQIFEDAVNNIGQKEFSVLVYYGIAGIGKTSLRKELPKYLEESDSISRHPKVIWASIDLLLDKFREKNTFLVTLKNDLQKKYKINFPSFEIAHAIYWKKSNPEIPLRKENYLFFEGDNAFGDFFGVVDKIPYFNIVPATARLLKNVPNYFRIWWTKRGGAELKQLSEKEPLEIEEMLPYFWAQDLNSYLEQTSISAILFIDTYEALWEKNRAYGHSRDNWIRDELIPRLPRNTLWVICGREALRWEEINSEWSGYITQCEVNKLSKEYSIEYLESRDIDNKEIQEAIINGSNGIPYYLELSAQTYEKIAEIREPQLEDFVDNYPEIADRFFRFLSFEEKRLLSICSVLRFWDNSLLEYLVKEFNTGDSLQDYENLSSFSFIIRRDNNKFQMQQLMKESLEKNFEKENYEIIKRVHKVTSEYYSNKLEDIDIKAITPEHEIALAEAFYHAKKSFEAEYLLSWFIVVSDTFERAAFWQLIAPMYEEILQVLEAKLGSEHPSVATTLNNLAELYDKMGTYEKSLPIYQKALDIRKKVLGPEHPDVATTLNNLAELYYNMGAYDKALPIYQKALDIRKKVLGPEHPDVATTLNNLAALYRSMGTYDKALPLYQRALDISEKVLGPEHPDVATTLNNLALLYNNMGDYDKALPLYQRALDIRKKVLGSEHPDVATTLNNLAELYRSMGTYDKALPLYQRALEIREKVLGPEHPDAAITLNNLALLYNNMGAYDKALLLSQRALDIREKVLGSEHPSVATTLNNLALLYNNMGDYDKALPLYQRALDVREKVLGPEHPSVATTLNNLAELYRSMGAYDKALLLSQRDLEIREKVLGPEHPDVATTLNNLAELYRSMEAYDKALPLYQRALNVREKVLGPEHPSVATTLNNLAELYENMGAYDKALSLYQRANIIFENSFGEVHPSVGIVSRNLARVLTLMSQYKSKNDKNLYDFEIENENIATIEKIDLDEYRECPTEKEFNFGKVNLLFGPNGSGKTSLLEAIELFFCGKNLRNPDKLNDYKIRVRFKDSLNDQDISTNTIKRYNLRDKYWYNNPYDPNKNSSDLHIGFNRYNFYNTDSAFILFNEKKSGKVKKAFEDITLGENVNYIEERINKYHDEFKTRLSECENLLFEYKDLVKKEKGTIQKIKEINLEHLREEFIEEARRIKWAKKFDEISPSILTDFKIDYNKVETYLNKARENIKWIKNPTVEILEEEKNKLNQVRSQIKLTDINIEENKEEYLKGELSENLNENNLEILINEKIEQINDSIQLINDLSEIIYISPNDSLDKIMLDLETLYTTFREFKAEMNQNRVTEIQNENTKLKIKEIETKINELENNRKAILKGTGTLSYLLETHGKGKYLQDFILSNNREIFRIFNSIHIPKEFEDIKFDENSDIILKRNSSSEYAELSTISTGQRSALALSIFLNLNKKLRHGPPYIIFDDPIAYIDDLNVLSFLDYLREVAIQTDRQIFFATSNKHLAFLFSQKFKFLGDSEFKTFIMKGKQNRVLRR
jgi:tetratricopeptide (TPR) repeat protein